MKKLWSKLVSAVVAVSLSVLPMFGALIVAGPVFAADENDGGGSSKVETSILPSNMDIDGILKLVLNVLVYGLGAAAVLGVIIAGIQYMTARDNEGQVATAKKRLIEIVIGLVAWAVMYGALNWLIPGTFSWK